MHSFSTVFSANDHHNGDLFKRSCSERRMHNKICQFSKVRKIFVVTIFRNLTKSKRMKSNWWLLSTRQTPVHVVLLSWFPYLNDCFLIRVSIAFLLLLHIGARASSQTTKSRTTYQIGRNFLFSSLNHV